MKFTLTDIRKKILFRSLSDAWKGKIWRFFLGSISTCIAVASAAKIFFGANLQTSSLIGGSVLVGLFFIRFIAFCLVNSVKYWHEISRESVYGDAIVDLKDGFATLHFLRKKEDFDDLEFMTAMVQFCNTLKQIFDRKTKAKCAVSFKVPTSTQVSPDCSMKNLCRDKESGHRDTIAYQQADHRLLGNTAFSKILYSVTKGDRRFHYLNNDISASRDYENTSKDIHPNGLPYQSELVIALLPLIKGGKVYDLLGFICVDCAGKNGFDEKYDLAILEGVADGVYDIMLKRNNTSNNKKKSSNEAA